MNVKNFLLQQMKKNGYNGILNQKKMCCCHLFEIFTDSCDSIAECELSFISRCECCECRVYLDTLDELKNKKKVCDTCAAKGLNNE
jgi:hypothetical protein